jgi:hypothetical protein
LLESNRRLYLTSTLEAYSGTQLCLMFFNLSVTGVLEILFVETSEREMCLNLLRDGCILLTRGGAQSVNDLII